MPQEEPHAGSQTARREEAVRGETAGEEAVRLRVGQRLRELAQRLDQPSFALLLKVLGGVNAAFAHRNEEVAIDLTEEERALYTPELQGELVTLLELASFPRQHVRLDDHPLSPPDAP
ncbi:hypothetical protein [Streptomyces iconiensis]|uniref:Uncharacterized protein n=1 Tax=Streptomyces iconiensis TaxID=1384038 RepID=A0ABT6ZVZ1_9ACTN|nr:hypothetical protein [Streptomyces iconiensis]MDJ1133225.1 hypothetical protein [Streptomyces iconiensis]